MIYLDYNATTPVLPEVREAMLPYLGEQWGNPSSAYRFGADLKSKIDNARESVAELIGAKSLREVLFTSGGTESNNTAIHGATIARPEKRHIITSQVEHSSVLTYCRYLERHHGYRVTYLPVDREGLLSITGLENALTEDTAIVSLMWANNETGVLFPVDKIAQLCRSRGVPYHCDAVQAVGKLLIDVGSIPFDYLSITGHKFGAVKGVGALYVAKKAPFFPFVHGGHQERARRGGTENVPCIVGIGEAATQALKRLPLYASEVQPLRDYLEHGILSGVSNAERNGHSSERLANTSNITFHGVESAALLLLLDQSGVCASSGSACLADSPDPSHVLVAMKGVMAGNQNVRFSLPSIPERRALSEARDQVIRIVQALRDER